MSDISKRYRLVARRFTERSQAVPAEAWDNPAPCDGWMARDVIRHLVAWIPGFFSSNADLELVVAGPVDEDPVAAWTALDQALQSALDDPEVAGRTFKLRGHRHRVEDAIAMFCVGDVLVHTWDLGRAAGLDESLDPDEVHRMLVDLEPMDELLRTSGHYGSRVAVPDDADEQTQLIAFTGRRP